MAVRKTEWVKEFNNISEFIDEYELKLISIVEAVTATWGGDYIVDMSEDGRVTITKIEEEKTTKMKKSFSKK